jgi:Protein of unknown function (DUF1573).
MKRFFLVIFLLSLPYLCMGQGKPEAKYSFLTFDLGFVTKDSPVVTVPVTVSNTGKAPLIYQEVSVSCPCVTVDYPRSPLAPGESAVIKITYDGSKQPLSRFTKEIFLPPTLKASIAVSFSMGNLSRQNRLCRKL